MPNQTTPTNQPKQPNRQNQQGGQNKPAQPNKQGQANQSPNTMRDRDQNR